MRRSIATLVSLVLTGTAVASAVEFKGRTITVAPNLGWRLVSHLADADGDGLTDLFARPAGPNTLQFYRQRRSGFAPRPDQTIALPERTAWIAVRDVDPHQGNELVISTAAGLFYLRQDQGVFESSPQTLIEARQVFATGQPRAAPGRDAGDAIPVIFEDHAVFYERAGDGTWQGVRTVDLGPTETQWNVREDHWMMGPTPAYSMEIRTTVGPRPQNGQANEDNSEKQAVQKLIRQVAENAQWRLYEVHHTDVDIDGDGREDLVVWKMHGDISPRTTILLFPRGRDGRLPARPTEVLRVNGIPIQVDREHGVSPLWDLDGDGRCELILIALKTRITSWSGLVDLALSGGVDWVFTVRSGRNADYSGSPDFQMDVTSSTPREKRVSHMFVIDGDFNGDGRKDILVERATEQFDVYVSSAKTGFFQKTGPLRFAATVNARTVDTSDLNGDGISDLFVQELLEARITIFLSQRDDRKGTQQ